MARLPFAVALLLLMTLVCPPLLQADDGRWVAGTETILSPVRETKLGETSLRLRATGAPGRRDSLTFAIPVGQGELTLDVVDVALRSSRTGGVVALSELEDGEAEKLLQFVRQHLKLEEYGYLRHLRTARLVAGSNGRLAWGEGGWEWAEIDVRIHWEDNPQESPADPHMQEGPWRELLENIVVHPEAIDRLAHRPPLIESKGPTEWQPDPESGGGHGWLAIPVEKTGLYAIDRRWLEEAGIPPDAFEPGRVGIFHEGEPVPITLLTPPDRGFAAGGRLAFKGLGNESSETRENVYFLRALAGEEEQRRMKALPESEGDHPIVLRHQAFQKIDEDDTFKTRFGSFLSVREMVWVGSELAAGEPHAFTFDLPSLNVPPGEEATVQGELALYTEDERQRRVEVEIRQDGNTVTSQQITGANSRIKFTLDAADLREQGNTLEFALAEQDVQRTQPRGIHIDWVSFQWPALLEGRGGRLEVDFARDPSSGDGAHTLRTVGFNPARLLALDVTDPRDPVELPVRRDRANALVDAALKPKTRLVLEETTAIGRAPLPRAVHWMDFGESGAPSDVLVVYHGSLEAPALRLVEDLRGAGFPSRAILLESVFNSFSHGHLSTGAIRRFISHAVYHWEHPPLGVILIGDANSDGRGVARNDVPNQLPVPLMGAGRRSDAGEVFSTDAWYSWLTEGDELADLFVSRLPFATADDAMNAVHNIIRHRELQDQAQPWADRIVTIADTGNFKNAVEEIDDDSVMRGFRSDFIFADDFPWEDNYYLPAHLLEREEDAKVSPLVTAAIEDSFNDGAAVVAFLGHGAPNLWSNQRFWFGGGTPNSDIPRLANGGRLPFVVSYTCNNAVIDYPLEPWNICIAEDFLRHRDKGAIAAFMPSGPGYLRDHEILARTFNQALTALDVRQFGPLAELARVGHQFRRAQDDQARMYLLLGDFTLSNPPSVPAPATDPKPREKAFKASGEDVLIRAFRTVPADEASPREARWLAEISNQLHEERSTPWALRLFNADGDIVQTARGEVTIPPRSSVYHPLAVEVPNPGHYVVEFELPHHSGAWYADTTPTRRIRDHVPTVGGDRGTLYIPPASLRFLGQAHGNNPRRLQFLVANPTEDPIEAFVKMEIIQDGEVVESAARTAGRVAAGGTVSHSITLGLGPALEGETTFVLRLREGQLSQEEEEAPLLDEVVLHVDPQADLPNLVIDRESITLTPPVLSDGLTVFVDALVRNEGNVLSPAVEAGLFRPEDTSFSKPLRDMTQRRDLTPVAPLHPGEERRIRLRWDPYQNAGRYDIVLAVDPRGAALESDRTGNVETIELDVKTKWNLVTGSIRVARSEEPNTILLVAQVGNSGETDAREVTVNFYRSREQDEESRLGEMTLDRVPAETLETVIFEWRVTVEDLEDTNFDPSFTIALKGSQRRVSSISED